MTEPPPPMSSDRLPDLGYLYILANPSMPGLLKVGKTARDPNERARELSGATGVPIAFVVAWVSPPLAGVAAAEAEAHAALAEYRLAENREFFRLPAEQAMQVLAGVAKSHPIPEGAMPCPGSGGSTAKSPRFTPKDPLFRRAGELCVWTGSASPSFLQDRLNVDRTRAAQLLQALEDARVVSPPVAPGGGRKVLMELRELDELLGLR